MPTRVFLRAPRASDVEAFTALVRASRRLHAHWVAPARDPAAFEAFLARSRTEDSCAMLILRRDDRVLLGAVNLSQIRYDNLRSAYLGYWIGEPYAREGYMREALAQMLGHAFRELRLHRIEASIQPENIASRALVEGLGFRLEGYSPRYLKLGGRWRDHERWALLHEHWRGSAPPPRGSPPRRARTGESR